ncbi:MAG: hypothetical protein EPO32_14940 [Anaerolineae bacterium]|nr:MAG: hypothetical protein EPO32_14940 [Anaerolineae bacterium]
MADEATPTTTNAAPVAPAADATAAAKAEPVAKTEIGKAIKSAKVKLASAPANDAPANDNDAAAAPAPTEQQLRDLAKQLGFEVENKMLTTRERVAMREHAKFLRESAEREVAEARKAFEQERSDWEPRMKKAQAIAEAYEAGDYEALARAIDEENKGWDDLQNKILAKVTDPNYKEIQEMKRWRVQQEKERKEASERERAAHVERERANYRSELSAMMKASKDPLVSAMHDDPGFINAVFRIQEENWDGEKTVTPERAIKMAMKGARVPLSDELQTLYSRLAKAFGGAAATAAVEAVAAASGGADEPVDDVVKDLKRPAPRTSVKDPAQKPAPSAAGKRTEKEWFEDGVRQLREAAAEEEAAKRRIAKS